MPLLSNLRSHFFPSRLVWLEWSFRQPFPTSFSLTKRAWALQKHLTCKDFLPTPWQSEETAWWSGVRRAAFPSPLDAQSELRHVLSWSQVSFYCILHLQYWLSTCLWSVGGMTIWYCWAKLDHKHIGYDTQVLSINPKKNLLSTDHGTLCLQVC